MQNKNFNQVFYFLSCATIALLLFTSCNPLVYLDDNEALLTENKIKLRDRKYVDNTAVLREELELQYMERPNKEFAFIPREWFYYRFDLDTSTSNSRFKRVMKSFISKNISEEPSIHRQEDVDITVSRMQNYLRNKKGYYHAEVEADIKIKDKEAYVSYIVRPGVQYTVRNLEYVTKDPRLKKYIDSLAEETLIPPGTPINESIFNTEKTRLARAIQNQGFASFNTNYIEFQGDTSNLKMDVFVNILRPAPDSSHQLYTIGEIKVFTDHSPGAQQLDTSNRVEIDGIDFYSSNEEYFVQPQVLQKRIFIEEGKYYQNSQLLRTRQGLNNLNTYRFTNLNASIDENIDTVINYNFLLSPVSNKWTFEPQGNAYFSNIARDENSPLSSNFLGLQGALGLSSRNLFQSAVNLDINLSGYIEFNLREVNSRGVNLESGFKYPRLYDFLGLFKISERLNVLPTKTYQSLKDNTITNISGTLSSNYTNTIYGLTSLNSSFGINYSPSANRNIILNQAGINYLRLRPEEVFQQILNQNPYLANSFNDRLLTGIIFRDMAYTYNSKISQDGFNWGLLYYFEVSGFEMYLANSLYNTISGRNDVWRLPNGRNEDLEFAKYFKIDLDHRFNQRIFGQHNLAGRFRAGLAYTFGDSQSIPFVRQFSVGGQNSVRGWQIRDLGPGGYISPDADSITLPYQTGDFIIEGALEYRFPIKGFIKGAFFIDAGNVWVLSDIDGRENSQLTADFYKQIAVASGFGIRLDFTYFLLRFDLGYKIRNPYPDETGSYLNYRNFKLSNIRDVNPVIGVNMPF